MQVVDVECRRVTGGARVADKFCMNGGPLKKPVKRTRGCYGSYNCPEINRHSNSPNSELYILHSVYF